MGYRRGKNHGMSGTPEHGAWRHMKARCNNKTDFQYKNYGARGIVVCERWESFVCFLNDMGKRPSPTHSLDRIDNNGNYEPGNCRWATKDAQVYNTRKTVMVMYNGAFVKLRDLTKTAGLRHIMVYKRIFNLGWTIERAISEPPQRRP